jgi:hypothetical protein
MVFLGGSLLGILCLSWTGSHRIFVNGPRHGWLFFAASVTVAGFGSLIASFVALSDRKRAALLCLAIAPVSGLCAWLARDAEWGNAWAGAGAFVAAVVLLIGLFWLGTRNWAPIEDRCTSGPQSAARLVGRVVVLFLLICVLAVMMSASWEEPGDCGEAAPFGQAAEKFGRAVFVARVIHTDSIFGSVALVEQRFWGLSRFRKIVILKAPGPSGERYLVDGRLDNQGILTRYVMPVFEMHCTASQLLRDAKVELRVLRDSPHWDGVRIIGKAIAPSLRYEPVPGLKVIIAGPAGTVSTTTDRDGIYDLSGLPPGRYTVRADVYDPVYREYPRCRSYQEGKNLGAGDVWGCTLLIYQ